MKTFKNSLLSITAFMLILILSFVGVQTYVIESAKVIPPMIFVAFGMLLIIATSFLNEKLLNGIALIGYLCVIAVLYVQILSADNSNYVSMRYLDTGRFIIHTASLVPITYLLIAKMITKYDKSTFERLVIIVLVMIIPLALLFGQANLSFVIINFAVYFITLIFMKAEARINLPWIVFAAPALVLIATIVLIYADSDYASFRMETILSRGKNSPEGLGWMRTISDFVLLNTPFIGSCAKLEGDTDVAAMIARWGNHNVLAILAEYGWAAFLLLIVVYILLFVVLFRMVSKTKQGSFSKYLSLLSVLYLCVKAAFSLFGLFFLDKAPTDMPFISNNYTIGMVDYFLAGIIFSRYFHREGLDTSAINQQDQAIILPFPTNYN